MKQFAPLISVLALFPVLPLAGRADNLLPVQPQPNSASKGPPGLCLLQLAALDLGLAPSARPGQAASPSGPCILGQAVFDNSLPDPTQPHVLLNVGARAPARPALKHAAPYPFSLPTVPGARP